MVLIYIEPDELIERLLRGEETQDVFSVLLDGKEILVWSRQELHRKIVCDIIRTADKNILTKKPIAIFMGGGSASGKSIIREGIILPKLIEAGYKPVVIDPDMIKEHLYPYQDMKKKDTARAASSVHAESKVIAFKAILAFIEKGYSFLYDSTMSSRPLDLLTLINHLKARDYYLIAAVVVVPLELALNRAAQRGRATGRIVPPETIKYTHKNFPITFWKIEREFDEVIIFDNSVEPEVIAERKKDLQVYNVSGYNDFRRRGEPDGT